ncbi:MAG: ABC transporter ATP-binding protein, partial [Pseudomonadota bacterium]
MKNSIIKRSFGKVLWNSAGADLLLSFAVVGVVAASLIPPQILKRIIDNNLIPRRPEGLFTLAIAYIAVLVLVGAFDFLKEAVLTVLGQKITREIRHTMMEKLERIYAGYFSVNDSGAIVSRFTNDVDAISAVFTGGIVGMLVDCFKIIGIVASIWLFSPKLGIAVLVLLPLIYGITRTFQKRMLTTQKKNRVIVGKVNNHIAESLKNVQMIKAFGKEGYMEDKYKNYLMENYNTIEKVNYYDSVFPPIVQIVRGAVIGMIVVMSSAQLNLLGISAGMVAASIELMSNLFAPIESLGMELQNIQQAFAGIGRVEEFYREQEDGSKLAGLRAEDIIPVREDATLSFNDVSFRYEEGIDVLENISIAVKPLEKVAFTGRTGVGKSTLFKLCMGLLKPSSGSITINGIDVYDIPNAEKRKLFGYVDQGFFLIKGTVAEQIS